MAREGGEHEACAPEEVESDREENDEAKQEHSKPATLLWLVQKLSRIAKLEASYSPRNPLKVRITCSDWKRHFSYFLKASFFRKYFSRVSNPPKFLGTFEPQTAAILSAPKQTLFSKLTVCMAASLRETLLMDNDLYFQRTCIFKFLGAVAMDLGKDKVKPYLPVIIAPLFRELNSTYSDQGNSAASLLNPCTPLPNMSLFLLSSSLPVILSKKICRVPRWLRAN